MFYLIYLLCAYIICILVIYSKDNTMFFHGRIHLWWITYLWWSCNHNTLLAFLLLSGRHWTWTLLQICRWSPWIATITTGVCMWMGELCVYMGVWHDIAKHFRCLASTLWVLGTGYLSSMALLLIVWSFLCHKRRLRVAFIWALPQRANHTYTESDRTILWHNIM